MADRSSQTSPVPSSVDDPNVPWWKLLNRYHWFVFAMATAAWVFDCLDQQIFILARGNALKDLMPEGTNIKEYGGYATSIFVIGWATGGLIFGTLGDRFGRARMLTITVLTYSLCTGLSAFSRSYFDFALFRFLTGVGVGGVFGLAVALVADTLPSRARTPALGILQALSAVGNITAGLVSIGAGRLVQSGTISESWSWKLMFLVGAAPAFLCVFIQLRLKEPERWVAAREAGKTTGVKFGSYSELFTDSTLLRNAIFGMMLCVAGVAGVWGIGFFAPELVTDVVGQSLAGDGKTETEIAAATTSWIGVNSIVQNIGAFLGMLAFTFVAEAIGRKKTFVLGFIAAGIATVFFFQTFSGTGDIWKSFFMGFFQLALFAGFAIYLPELFPLRLRSTGTSFCYNVGRYLAATGPFTIGYLAKSLSAEATTQAEKIDAFRDAASYMTAFYLLGILALLFLPETKGQELRQD